MKFVLIAFFTLTCAVSVQATEINFAGNFSAPHKTFIFGYENKKSCLADKGEWSTEDEVCLFDVSDVVKVQTSAQGATASIETIGANAHTCGFEEPVIQKSANELLAQVETEVYEYNSETKQGEFVKAICEVTITYKDSDTVSVTNNGNCQEYCGARAFLHIDEAKRAAPSAE